MIKDFAMDEFDFSTVNFDSFDIELNMFDDEDTSDDLEITFN